MITFNKRCLSQVLPIFKPWNVQKVLAVLYTRNILQVRAEQSDSFIDVWMDTQVFKI